MSAGGGLAAALALLARDRGTLPLALHVLRAPMLDDCTVTADPPYPYAGESRWTPQSNRFGWTALLGQAPGSAEVSPYAAAARAEHVAGLPPTCIAVGTLDLFVDEDVAYAKRLLHAGVPTELHVYLGAFHGFQLVPTAHVTQVARRDHSARDTGRVGRQPYTTA